MFILNKSLIKFVSVFLSLNILSYTLAPTISYALTAGPTAPESTSFEPVDTTDMVNLLTGDLAYNLPVLEVPGPEGGYSMSLSYHAGIRPDEESSWVGLGWSLNAGAINRNVDGAPDDAKQNIITQTRYIDQGGGQVQNVDVMGFKNGIGTIFTAHNFEGNGGLGSLALVESSRDQTFTGKEAYKGFNDDLIRKRVKEFVLANNGKPKGEVRTEGSEVWDFPSTDTKYSMKVVPIPNIPDLYIDVKSNYWRWYKIQEGQLQSKGALYANDNLTTSETNSSDAYKLFSNSTLMMDGTQADKFSYGSLPSNDFYNVSAQGLGGSIKPYNFENGTLFLQDEYTNQNDLGQYVGTTYKKCSSFSKKVNFRFEGDFSNSLSITPERIVFNTNTPAFAGTVAPHTLNVNSQGYNSATQQIAGSRHVDWYSINQVNNGFAKNKGLINYQNIDNQYNSGGNPPFKKFIPTDTSMIAGFKIINEDGTTYHYALPVYAYDEISVVRANGNNYARIESLNKNAYAYEWLLTSITGNDYVDRNNNGYVDNADWGYWTAFEYGRWTDKYRWRSPVEGYNIDIDGSNETYTSGLKELYYLDAIKTRTHTALFVKSIKTDGKGVKVKEGGVGAIAQQESTGNCAGGQLNASIYSISIASLKLDNIYLLSNDDLNSFLSSNTINNTNLSYLKSTGTIYNDSYSGQTICSANGAITGGYYINYHLGDNVLDKNDLTIAQFNDLKKKSLKTIQFNTSYSLCPGTPNSFLVADNYANDIIFGNPLTKMGKLTLNSIKVYGRSGADLIPSYNFNYDASSNISASFKITQLNNGTGLPNLISFGTTAPNLSGGEVLKFTYSGLDYYASLSPIYSQLQGAPGSGVYLYYAIVEFLGANIPNSGMVNLSTSFNGFGTKNPAYGNNMLDIWGMFKSDYRVGYYDENWNRRVNTCSLKNLNIWNLSEIETPIGAKIKITYEADSYVKPKVFNNYSYNISSMTPVPGSTSDMVLSGLLNDGTDLTSIFTVGSQCNFVALIQTPPSSNTIYEEVLDFSKQNIEIIAVTQNTITVRATNLVNKFNGCYNADFSAPIGGTCSNTFIGGKLKYYKGINISGGGLRVKNLAVEGSGIKKETIFTYESSPGVTSGVTSFEPYGLDKNTLVFPSNVVGVSQTERLKKMAIGKDAYMKVLYREFSEMLKLSRLLPAPGVMYEFVTVTEKSNNIEFPSKVRYQFQVFDNDMISVSQDPVISGDPNNQYIHKLNYLNTIKDNTIRLGNLKSILTYDKDGRVISRSLRRYLHDNTDQPGFENSLSNVYNNQGKISQSFNEYKLVTTALPIQDLYGYAVTNLVEEYPSILLKEETYDLLKGNKSEIQYVGFDFYSGMCTKQFYKDSYGNNYIKESVPAYTKYPEMGLKVNTPSNRHMLSQSTASYTHKSDANGNIQATLSADVVTWNKVWNYRMYDPAVKGSYYTGLMTDNSGTIQDEQIWRPYRNYVFNSPMLNKNGTIQNFVNFDWVQEAIGQPQNKFWQKNSEVKMFDPFSKSIESVDVNGNYISSKFGYSGSEVLMVADNSRYTEMAYSGAEDDALVLDATNNYNNYFGGEVLGKSIRSSAYAHTGKYSIPITAGNLSLLYFINKNSSGRNDFDLLKNYRASIWVHKDYVNQAKLYYVLTNDADNSIIYTASAIGNTSLAKAGDWYLLPLDFSIPYTALTNVSLKLIIANTGFANTVYYDDFRFHPLVSSVSSCVYDPQTRQVTHILDNENFYTRFEYDPFGRLTATYKETINGEKKINDYYYNYGRKP